MNFRFSHRLACLAISTMVLFGWCAPSPGEQFAISIGATVTTNAPAEGAGIIATSSEIDTYTFSGEAGQIVFLEELSVDAAFQGWLYWDLRSPGNVSLMSAYFEGTDEGRRVLPESGTYTLRVRVTSGNTAHTGRYSFKLWMVPADHSFGIQIGSLVATNTPSPGAGSIETPGSWDIYEFTAAAGQLAFFEELAVSPAFKGWLQWELKSPSGTTLFNSYLGNSHEGRKTLSEAGKYRLRVYVGANDPAMLGHYSFRIREIPPDPIYPISFGQMISNGVPDAGAGNIEVAGAHDLYTFEGAAGQPVFFENLGVAPSLGGWLHCEVKTPSGQNLLSQFFNGSSPGRKTLPETGQYLVRFSVGSNNPDLVGGYAFRINPVEDARIPIQVGHVIRDGVPAPGAGHIETSGGQDLYQFPAVSGQRIVLEELSVSTSFAGWLKWELRSPASNQLATAYFQSGKRATIVLPDTGDYTFRVFVAASAPQYIGTYSFRMFCDVYAAPDTFATSPGTSLHIVASKFLCNDACQPMDALTVDLLSTNTLAGGLLWQTNGMVIYAPPAGFSGMDRFMYRARGLFGGEATTAATVRVVEGADGQASVISCFAVNATTAQVCLAGEPGRVYAVETSPDMKVWAPAGTVTADQNGSIVYYYSTTAGPVSFYRFKRP